MERTADRGLAPIVRWLLWADAAVELVVAFFLAGVVGAPDEWLDVSPTATVLATGVFVAAAGAIGAAAALPSTRRRFVEELGIANVLGGAAVWAIALFFWGRFSVEGRMLVAATGDAFVLVGILELLALRRTAPPR